MVKLGSSGPVASSARRVKHMPWSCPRFQRKASATPIGRAASARATRGLIHGASAPSGSSSGGSMRPFWITRSTSGYAARNASGTLRRPGSARSSESWKAT